MIEQLNHVELQFDHQLEQNLVLDSEYQHNHEQFMKRFSFK